MTQRYFITVPKGLEELLVDELKSLGCPESKIGRSGVWIEADLEMAYRVCLWSRLAHHVLLPITEFEAADQADLYQQIQCIKWLDIFKSGSSFKIDVTGQHSKMNNTQFIALKAKDAIVDQMRDKTGERPSIALESPDVLLHIHVNRQQFSVSLSLSGESLHKRGYRLKGGRAPLRETLAAAILMRGGWPKILADNVDQDIALIDPMCGSGTIVIEAAMMAYDIAPGLRRERFGFMGWAGHDAVLWHKLVQEAKAKAKFKAQAQQAEVVSVSNSHRKIQIIGSDISPGAIKLANDNISRAGLAKYIQIQKADATAFSPESLGMQAKTGLIIFNPPYGERLNQGDTQALKELFGQVGEQLKTHFMGWELAIITAVPELMKSIGIRSYKQYKLYNGALEAQLLKFHLDDKNIMRFETPTQKIVRQSQQVLESPSNQSLMFANRLEKNLKHLGKWAKREKIMCYRVYDADIPDFAFAIDCYGEHVHVQEYQAGKEIDPQKAALRVKEAVAMVHKVLNVPFDQIHLKTRQRQRGESQYEKLNAEPKFYTVTEGLAKLSVNFENYLDTGLFLDHRLMRAKVAEASKDKTLLNLFAYTCTASVQAALAGAQSVTSVDMSKTYLEWGERNFRLNLLNHQQYDFIQADCLQWLAQNEQQFDVIFLDPPTFSNSKRMENTLDIQRDHVDLIHLAMHSLKPEGVLFFSNNYRRFKIDPVITGQYQCQDISKQCLPEDFKRRPNIHHCFEIRQ